MSQRTVVSAADIVDEIYKEQISEFTNLDVSGEIHLSGTIPVMFLTFNDCKFNSKVRVKFLDLSEGLHFYNCEFSSEIALEHVTLSPNGRAFSALRRRN